MKPRGALAAVLALSLPLRCAPTSSPPATPQLEPLPASDASAAVADASVPDGQLPSESFAPEPPRPEPLDPTLDVEGWWVLGANSTHAWLQAVLRGDAPAYSVVVDLMTACAVESYREPQAFAKLWALGVGASYPTEPRAGAETDARALAVLSAADSVAEIKKLVGLGSRFGLTGIPFTQVTWSARGPHVLVAAGLLYHSRDGGQTFRAIDSHAARNPSVAPDGRTVVYERCRAPEAVTGLPTCAGGKDLVGLALDRSSSPVVLTRIEDIPRAFAQGFSADGHALIWRTDAAKGCLEYVDPRTGVVDREACVADPHFARRGSAGGAAVVKWMGLSPSERFAAIEWEGFTARYTRESAVVDLREARIAHAIPEWMVRGVDDEGGVVALGLFAQSDNSTYYLRAGRPKQRLWREGLLDWDARTRRAILEPAHGQGRRKLGAAPCKLVRIAHGP